jgi:hypothetical protein
MRYEGPALGSLKGCGQTLALNRRAVRFASDQDLPAGLDVWLKISWPAQLPNGNSHLQRFGAVGLKNAEFGTSRNLRKLGGAHMRTNLYTKTILTLIALLLAVIALKPITQPQAVMAQGNFAGIQFSYSGGNHAFFNANTGDVWEYGDHGTFRNHYKIRELGKDHVR